MKRIVYITIIIFVLLLLNGCMPKVTHTLNMYDISQSIKVNSNIKVNKVLNVKYPISLGSFGGSRIYYKKDGITSYYKYSRWSDSLNKMFYKSILETLLKSKKYKSITNYNSSANADIVLEITILDFYHIIEENNSYLLSKISVKLIDEKSSKLLKSKLFVYKKSMKVANAKNLYIEAKELLNDFLVEFMEEL